MSNIDEQFLPPKKKLKGTFFKSHKKQTTENVPLPNVCSFDEQSLEAVDFVGQCAFFQDCAPALTYDIGLVVGKSNLLSDQVKYQWLKCENYLPDNFTFPPNNQTPAHQCSYRILKQHPFLGIRSKWTE